jgi:hypothetical protein
LGHVVNLVLLDLLDLLDLKDKLVNVDNVDNVANKDLLDSLVPKVNPDYLVLMDLPDLKEYLVL